MLPVSLNRKDANFDNRAIVRQIGENSDAAGGGTCEAESHANGGGFAGAVAAEETVDGAFRDVEREAVDGGTVALQPRLLLPPAVSLVRQAATQVVEPLGDLGGLSGDAD